jgi:hypothetical protein
MLEGRLLRTLITKKYIYFWNTFKLCWIIEIVIEYCINAMNLIIRLKLFSAVNHK